MKDRLDSAVGRLLDRWLGWVHARATRVVVGTLVATLALGVYAALELGVNSDNLSMVSEKLPSRIYHAEFSEHFPNIENALLIVVDGETPELARDGADGIEAALRERSDRFEDVYQPGGGAFFERNGLLYRSVEELDEFADRIATVQPIIAELERDASIASLTRLVSAGLESVRDGGETTDQWADVLDRVGHATVAVYAEFPVAISWEDVLLRGSALDVTTRHVVVAHPILDFGSVFAAGRALDAIHEAAAERGLVPERGITIRVTGNPALNYEEMAGILWDVFGSSLFCFALVAVILWFAMRSWHLVTAAIATLLVGLVFTAAFAAAAVGYLNIASLAVAILFIGLGVDFAIHLGTRYADLLGTDRDELAAMRAAAADVGGSLVLCTLTTAIAFYVFVPTDYRGVAQLGLIAGTSMIMILGLTLTFFPALLFSWLHFEPRKLEEAKVSFGVRWWSWFDAHPGAVRAGAAALAVLAALAVPRAYFDANVVSMRDPDTESVQAFNDLLAAAGAASPWYVDALAPDLAAADALAAKLDELDVVAFSLTLDSYVPDDQDEKLGVLEDVAFLLEPPPPPDAPPPAASVAEQVDALRALRDFLAADWVERDASPLGASMRRLRGHLDAFLARLDADVDPQTALDRLEEILLSGFPDQIARLRRALSPDEVTRASLPADLRRRMLADDGTARVQIFPKYNLEREEDMRRFVGEVQTIAPRASGIAVNLIALEDATKSSFRTALSSALVLMGLLLWLLWRRVGDMLLVFAPLALSAAITVALMGLLGIAFNFINVIVVPLLFGIGVDSGIHLVHRANAGDTDEHDLLGSTTARAVFYSALTTVVSFGSLGLSSHPGMASLGILLTIGMILTIGANLIVLPALLALRRPPSS
ncbi:MAG: MMPL family transporter [Myxococcales bacterium]|nr:MMPL family transporter [Myxococcales bacterium]